ncbi:MAG: 2OG-Fe(II) oxygenase [Planctomycetaceae bacterium]|nr:2OG-Fe(II) oxygenase [Planctomycetaceae bacterium]
MIVIDNFITDMGTLAEIAACEEFHKPKQWGWWDGWWAAQPQSMIEHIVQRIWGEQCPFPTADFPTTIAGFEYWTLAHEAKPPDRTGRPDSTSNGGDRLERHRDRDETLFARTGETKYPRIGAVFYPLDHHVKGGNLKIYDDDSDVSAYELIRPRYNRLVLFDSSVPHEVTPVIAGRRYAMAVNVWNYRIQPPSPRSDYGAARDS